MAPTKTAPDTDEEAMQGDVSEDEEFVNWDEAPDFTPVPKGSYQARLYEFSGPNPGAEYPYIAVKFEIAEEPYEGRKVFKNYSFSPKALPYMKRHLAALGVPADQMTGRMKAMDLFESVADAPCTLEVKVVPPRKGADGTEYGAKNEVVAVRPAKAGGDSSPFG